MYRSRFVVIAVVALAGVVMLAFEPALGGAVPVRGQDRGASTQIPAIDVASPFTLLAITRPADLREGRMSLQPLDPATLEPIPGYEPIVLNGEQVESAISPDGTMAAFVVHAPGELQQSDEASLMLIDLSTWTASEIARWESPPFATHFARPRFSPDAGRLYWLEGDPLLTGAWHLAAFDLASSTRDVLATLPAGLGIIEMQPLANRDRIALVAIPVQEGVALANGGSVSGSYAAGDAQVLVVDSLHGGIEASIALEGIAAGSIPMLDLEEVDPFPVHNSSPGFAWSDDGRWLYIAHAGSARLTTVDLEQMFVLDHHNLESGASLLDRLAEWLAPPVGATARAFSFGYAQLLDDGRRVAVARHHEQRGLNRAELERLEDDPVRLVDLERGTVLWETEVGGVQEIALARDGAQILVHSYPEFYPAVSEDQAGEHLLIALDAETGDVVARLALPGFPVAVMQALTVTEEAILIEVSGRRVVIVDPATFEIAGVWQPEDGEAGIYRLIPLP